MISTMKRAALALVLAACSTSSSNDFPPRPGGGGTAGDAGIGDGGVAGGGVPITGHVCLVSDLRAPTSPCDTTKAGGLKVTLGTAGAPGTATATTGADGSFTIAAPLGAGFTWHVTGINLVTSVMSFGTDNTIPAILGDGYITLLATVGLQAVDETHASVVVRAVSVAAPAAGITATLTPLADSDTFYDSDGSPRSPVWNNTSTQSGGVVWVPDVPLPGPVTITLGRTTGTTVKTTAAVERQAITFITQGVP
jgi:hypothetical protein